MYINPVFLSTTKKKHISLHPKNLYNCTNVLTQNQPQIMTIIYLIYIVEELLRKENFGKQNNLFHQS